LHLDRINDAIHKYHSAIQVAPKYLLAHWNLAFALQRKHSFDAALTEYRAAIDCTTDKEQLVMLHTSLGDVLREKAGENDDLEDAIAEYRRAIEIDQRYGWAHNNLGLVWRDRGKIDDAIAEFRNARHFDPENETMKENLRQALQAKEAGATKATSVAIQ
jgi:tetratricopeptide (TPR) repeat protein